MTETYTASERLRDVLKHNAGLEYHVVFAALVEEVARLIDERLPPASKADAQQ